MTTDSIQKGIIGLEYALPSHYIDQKDLARNLNIQEGKITVGLGIQQMGVPSENEDVISLAMTAVDNLLLRYNIQKMEVGRLEVGTESNFDGSKSIKTYLMELFKGNTSICGVDNTNACYGGTNALLNALSWLESSFWDGRYAIVVATDVSSYLYEPAIPTSGAGAVAILLGPNPVFTFVGRPVYYFSNENDFLKPKDCYPFPVMDAKKSIEIYQKAFENCYKQSMKLHGNLTFDYACFHSPYPKLPLKTALLHGVDTKLIEDSLLCSRRNGNSYTSSLYFAFISLLHNKNLNIGAKILMYSFGSGCASSIFILQKVRNGCEFEELTERLDARSLMDTKQYLTSLKSTNDLKNMNFENDLLKEKNRYYLEKIENFSRFYLKNAEDK